MKGSLTYFSVTPVGELSCSPLHTTVMLTVFFAATSGLVVPLTHPGSGMDRTFASERQLTALAMLYIGRLITCGIDYLFTPKTNVNSLQKTTIT